VNLLGLLLILLGIILGVVVGYFIARNLLQQKQIQARQTAEDIIDQANKEADNVKKEKLLEAKEENQILKEQVENVTS
jgi:ribonuclease Y